MQEIYDPEPLSISSAPLPEQLDELALDATRAVLAAQYRITSLFLKVGQVAEMLGLSTTAIHAQIREGRFPIAHRRVGNVVMVKLADFVEWYCAEATGAVASRRRMAEPPSDEEAQLSVIERCAETPKQRAARIKSRALESMRLDSERRAAAMPTRETPAERGARIHREALHSVREARSNGA